MSFHANHIRDLFPSILIPTESGELPVFLDNPAGTQVPKQVMDAVVDYYMHMNGNSGGTFATSQRSDAMVSGARERVADFLNAPSKDEIVFGANTTTLMFALSRALGKTLNAGDEIVLTRMDHDANVSPWSRLAEDMGLTVRWVDIVTNDCTLDLNSLEAALNEHTKIVATVHASNAVGTINPVQQIADMAHSAGALHVIDAVQSAPHVPIDVQAIDRDFLLCSAYKFYGPHVGIMWGRKHLMELTPAYKVRPAKDKSPYRWETGTPSFETISAVSAVMDYWAMLGEKYGEGDIPGFAGRRLQMKQGMMAVQEYERGLASQLIEGLQALGGVTISGITDTNRYEQRVPTVAFVREGHTPDEIAEYLAKHNIYVWSGDYYAVEIMNRLNRPDGMVRIGIGQYNTTEEIDRLLNVLGNM